MRIFITGADGFIGQHLVERLKHKHELSYLTCDLRDHATVTQQLREADPEIIVHLAARTEVEQSFYEQITFSDINYTGTVNLIESTRQLSNLKNFVFASTMEVYGWQPVSDMIRDDADIAFTEDAIAKGQLAFDESTPPNPNAPYAVAKFGCEKYLEYAHRSYGLPFTAIRQTNSYGRKDNNFFVTEQIIYQMLTNPKEVNLGYRKPFRNFIYIDDLLDAWEAVIENPDKCAGEIFCIGPNNAIRIEDYAKLIAQKLNWTGTINWDTKPARPGEIYLLNSTNAKITAALGWAPKVDISTGLDRTVAIWKNILANNLPFNQRTNHSKGK
jgi:nucleoside-diphosphate-sugar epimerase